MNTMLFFAIFSLLTIFYTILGFLASKKVHTTTDYFLAGRNLGLWPVTFTLVATQIGGGMLLGTAQDAYLYGLYGLLYTIGMTSGFIMLGLGIAGKLQSLNVATTAQIFESKYNSTSLRKIASVLSIITMWGLIIGQIVGSRSIIESLNLGMGNEIVFLAFWLFVILYTMVGGLHAVVLTDIFQVLVILAVFCGVFLYANFFGPWFDWHSIGAIQKSSFGVMPITINSFVATLFMPALFSLIEQDLAQRFFAARSKKTAAASALLAGAFMIVFALVPIYFGMQARLLGLPIAPGQSPLIPVVEFLTNELIVVLAFCAIIAAITSTADSLLCAISSNLAQDFDFSWVGKHSALKRSQLITLLIGISAVAASYVVPQNIITILTGSYTISVSCLLIPLLFAYFVPAAQLSKKAAYWAVIFGILGLCVIPFWHTDLPKALLPLTLSLMGYIIGATSSYSK